MLVIKDKTTKQHLSYMDIRFWNDKKIKEIVLLGVIDNTITITDNMIVAYNNIEKSNKSNASFVNRVRKLNKEGYFDVKDKR